MILSEIDEAGQLKLKTSTVAVIGLGGLGSSCALYLAAAGVGNLILVDFDQVESSNLQRQIIHSSESLGMNKVASAEKRLKTINPDIKIESINSRIEKDNINTLLQKVDVIVDASDNYPTRYLLNNVSLSQRIPLVHAAAIKFNGHVTTFNLKPSSPCYECLFENNNHNEESCESQGVFPPIVGVIGSMQASEALKVILELNTLDGHYQTFDLLNNKINTFKLSKSSNCPSCS